MAAEKRKYNYMDKVLQNVNERFISLSQDEIRRNNEILQILLNTLTGNMKETDALFKALYSRIFYGGSFYDGLKISNPEEYDLDLLLDFNRMKIQSTLTPSNIHGFVTVKLGEFDVNDEKGRKLSKLINPKRLLDPLKVLSWMEGVLQATLNRYPNSNGCYTINTSNGKFRVKVHKGGPALTLKINADYKNQCVTMDIDLVTCFEYPATKWPAGFKRNTTQKPNFFVVPKSPKGVSPNQPSWRLSFQEQERELIKDQKHLKPTIKLLKQLRDVQNHKCIASYYIKTVVLNLNDKITNQPEFWRNSLSYVFMTVLKEYQKCIENQNISYYWKPQNNLIDKISPITLTNVSNRLQAIITDIDRNIENPETILKYLINSTEVPTPSESPALLPPNNENNNYCILS